jgi:asparagine synthetase B (glutamine-hydrolysing)
VDDVYCMFVGMLENLPQLRQTYGLSKMINEVVLITEMYKVLRDRGPYTADQVIKDLSGAFAFVLYDNKTKTLLVAGVSDLFP